MTARDERRRSIWTFLQDEKGGWSSARIMLFSWLVNAAAFLWRHHDAEAIGAALTFFSGVAIALIAWAGGARVAQYLGPQVGAAASAVADAAKAHAAALAAKVAARRNVAEGYEVSK